MSALDTQVGGNHYREGGIQPIQYIEANSLQFLEASVVKRVTRHNRATGKGRQDIEKAIHELQLLLELRYAATGGSVSSKPTDRFVGEEPSEYKLPPVKNPLPMPKCAPTMPRIHDPFLGGISPDEVVTVMDHPSAPMPECARAKATVKQATHRDEGGNLFMQDEKTGRWLQWGIDDWFFASGNPAAVPDGLRPL